MSENKPYKVRSLEGFEKFNCVLQKVRRIHIEEGIQVHLMLPETLKRFFE